jgi:TetR/AcrR family transcriptional repressor of nem operon
MMCVILNVKEDCTMGSSQADKVASHRRIVDAASARVRRDGVDAISVADLMAEAGLTHGAFYRHFDSRDELIDEAVEAALAHGSSRTTAVAQDGGTTALTALIDAYLGALHRDRPETGCAVAALPTDVARSSARARNAYTRQVESYLALLDSLAPSAQSDEAPMVLAALVGAVALARAVDDATLSDRILESTARALRRHVT